MTSRRSTRPLRRPKRDGAEHGRPQLLCCRTVIGKGAPTKAGTADVHGAALGEKEVAATRLALGWTSPPFVVPDAVAAAWNARARGPTLEQAWSERFAAYRSAHPALAAEFSRRTAGELPVGLEGDRSGGRRRRGREGRERGDAQGLAAGARSTRADAPGAPRRLRRSHGLGVHELVGQPADRPRGSGQLPPFRCTRVRDERDRQRPRAARRIHALCRHVSHVLRLRA